MAKLYTTGIVITGDATGGLRAMRLTREELRLVEKQMGAVNTRSRATSGGLDKLVGSSFSLHGILRQLTPVFGAFSAGLAARSIVDAGLAMDGYGRALMAVLGSAEAAASELEFVRKEAERVGVEFQPLVREYAKLAAAARDTKVAGQGVRDIFTGIIEVSRTLNLSSEDTRGAIFALQQMLSKGTVSAEELRRQLGERVPGSMNAMARAVGVSVQQLDKMLKQGQLISEDVMPKFAEELKRMAAGGLEFAQKSPAAEFDRLKNAIFDFNVAAGKNVMPVLAEGARILAGALNGLHDNLGLVVKALGGFLIIRTLIIPAITAYTTAVRGLTAAEGAHYAMLLGLEKAGKGWAAVVKMLGGPIMTALIAGTTAAYFGIKKYNEFLEESAQVSEETAKAMERLERTINSVGTAFGLNSALMAVSALEEQVKLAADEVERLGRVANAMPQFAGSGEGNLAYANALQQQQAAAEKLKNTEEELEKALAVKAGQISAVTLRMHLAGEAQESWTNLLGFWNETAKPAAQYIWDMIGGWEAFVPAGNEAAVIFDELKKGLESKIKAVKGSHDVLIQTIKVELEQNRLNKEQKEVLRELLGILEKEEGVRDSLRDKKEREAKAERELERARDAGRKTLSEVLKIMDPLAAAALDYNSKVQDLLKTQEFKNLSDERQIEVLNILRQTFPELTTEVELLNAAKQEVVKTTEEELEEMEAEIKALEYAVANNVSLTVAKLALLEVEGDLVKRWAIAEERLAELKKQYEGNEKSVDALTKAVKRGVERMDDAFADFWKSLLEGGGNAFDSLKRLAINTMAEIMHALTTRRLVAGISSAFAPAGTALAGGGTATGGGFSQLFTGSGMFSFGQGGGINNLIFGNGFGTSLASLPPWLGGASGGLGQFGPNYGIPQGSGLFAQAGNLPGGNLAYMGYGLAGGMLGNWISPNSYAGTGGSMGATLGAAWGVGQFAAYGAWAGPIGAAIGAVVGIALGSMFKDRKFQATLAGAAIPGAAGDAQRITTAFGQVVGHHGSGGWGSFADPNSPAGQIGEAIMTFDQAIYDMVEAVSGQGQLDAISEALASWRGHWEETNLTVEQVLGSRMDVILSTFEQDIQTFVRGAEDLEKQVERLGMALTAQNIIESSPDLFGNRSWQEFIVVAQALQEEGENLSDTFTRLLNLVQTMATVQTVLQGYADSNLQEDYLAMAQADVQTVMRAGTLAGEALREAIDNFDHSVESAVELSNLVAQRYQLEIAMLAEVDAAIRSIDTTLGATREKIQQDLRSDEENYYYYKQLAEQGAANLRNITDPTLLAQAVAEIDRYVNQAYGYATDEQRQAIGPEFITFLDEVQRIATENAAAAREQILAESDAFRQDIRDTVTAIGDPLLFVANSLGISADELSAAADDLSASADRLGRAGGPPGDQLDPISGITPVYQPNIEVDNQVDVKVDVNLPSGYNNTAAINSLVSSINALISQLRSGSARKEVGGSLI